MTNRTRQLMAGAFVAAAVAVPAYASITAAATLDVTAAPPCLAWFGNQEDGKCLSYSNGNGINVGTPEYNYCPGANANRDGCGWSSGPLLPGTTISEGIGVP